MMHQLVVAGGMIELAPGSKRSKRLTGAAVLLAGVLVAGRQNALNDASDDHLPVHRAETRCNWKNMPHPKLSLVDLPRLSP